MHSVFIDGSYGTTGLRIKDRIEQLSEYRLLSLNYDESKDIEKRLKMIDMADVCILCLPDEQSKEIVPLINNTKIIDTSTAHRTNSEFTYGFAEIGLRDKIKNSTKVSVCGCHATGYISYMKPLENIIPRDKIVSTYSLTGYSGGGKNTIEAYKSRTVCTNPMPYSINFGHKHLDEMRTYTNMQNPPLFSPIISNFYSGMAVCTMFSLDKYTKEDIYMELANFYKDEKLINVFLEHKAVQNGFLNPEYKAGLDDLDILVTGEGNNIMLIAIFDNLGKGASGNALQCLNILTGNNEFLGLNGEYI